MIREVNRGATVRALYRSEKIEIDEASGALEILIARRAATIATPEERDKLRVLRAEMFEAAKAAEPSTFMAVTDLISVRIGRIDLP